MKLKAIVLLLMCLLFVNVNAQVLKVGVGNFEPFFGKKEDKSIFIQLTKKIFEHLPEYELEFVHLPNKRIVNSLAQDKIDLACHIFKGNYKDIYLTENTFRFRAVGVSLKKKNLKVTDSNDLKNHKVIAFQGATRVLGKDFANAMKNHDKYSEHKIQSSTTFFLVQERADVRIGDINIFYNDLSDKKYKGKVDINDFNIHSLFKDAYSSIGSKDKELIAKLDLVVKNMKADGSYEKLFDDFKKQLTK